MNREGNSDTSLRWLVFAPLAIVGLAMIAASPARALLAMPAGALLCPAFNALWARRIRRKHPVTDDEWPFYGGINMTALMPTKGYLTIRRNGLTWVPKISAEAATYPWEDVADIEVAKRSWMYQSTIVEFRLQDGGKLRATLLTRGRREFVTAMKKIAPHVSLSGRGIGVH